VDAIFDPSSGTYLILDQDGAALHRWFPQNNSYTLIFGQQSVPLDVPSAPRDGPLNQAVFGRNLYGRSMMALQRDGSRAFIYDAAHWLIRIVDFASMTVSTLSGVNQGPLTMLPSFGWVWQNQWLNPNVIGGSMQRYVDVREIQVDRTGTYVYVLDETFVRRITVATGATMVITGSDAGYQAGSSPGAGATAYYSDCTYARVDQSAPRTDARYGPSSMILSSDGNTMYVLDRTSYIRMVNTNTGLCNWIAGSGVNWAESEYSVAVQTYWQVPQRMAMDPTEQNIYIIESQQTSINPYGYYVPFTSDE
jgi:hypothetical protein